SLGGTVGVSVLGAVLANRVTADLNAAFGGAMPQSGSGGTSELNLKALPPQVREVVMTVYGDATAHIFLISAAVGIVGVLAALALKPIRLRTTLDLKPQTAVEDADSVPTSARGDQETSPGSWVTGALSLSTHP